MEWTYIDLLNKLHTDAERDTIPDVEKTLIMEHILKLEVLLEKYSA